MIMHKNTFRTVRGAAAGVLVLTASLGLAGTALAQQMDESRFQIERVGEDVLRLDRATGLVELCVASKPAFVCREVVAAAPPADESATVPASGAMLAENEALKLENARLKRRLAMIAALVSDSDAADVAASRGSLRSVLPTDTRREIDEALDVTTYAVQRFSDLFRTLTEDANSN